MEPGLNLSDLSNADLIGLRMKINNVLSHRSAAQRMKLDHLNMERPPWVDDVVKAVAAERQIASKDLIGFRRDRPICAARWEIWRRLSERNQPTHRIAAWFKRDPTAVRYALDKMGVLRRKAA